MFGTFKHLLKKPKQYSINTYTLVKGVQLTDKKSVITNTGIIQLEQPEYITWKYLRGSKTLEDAFSNLNEEMNNMIPYEVFDYAVKKLEELNVVYLTSSESSIVQYLESDCQTVVNAELISDIRSKIYLKHAQIEMVLTPKEYTLLKMIINGNYDSINLKDWNIFFSLYKKEVISFI